MSKGLKVYIKSVVNGSIGEEAGIEAGDSLISINGSTVRDIFDYRYLTSEVELLLEVEKQSGEIWEIEIEKDEYEDLGLEFEHDLIDSEKSCANNCIFCFIDQLPKGMRKTLYFKDDDSRLSFLTGNYVTLTNIDGDEQDRIIKYRLSPVNISVHTTNPNLRELMLRNKLAGNVLKSIGRLIDGRIRVNCQIVLCKGINDGDELDRTISDLAHLYPGVLSISVVPVGITRYRENLYALIPFEGEAARMVVQQVEAWQKKLKDQYGSRIVYLADEFYIMSDNEIPKAENYEDFPQIENGVGLIALFRNEFYSYLDELCSEEKWIRGFTAGSDIRTISIATGIAPYKYICEMAGELERRYINLKINVYEIKNNFFGENVTVAGLLTGGDLSAQLEGRELGDRLLLCRCMLKSGEDIFLDDHTIDMLQEDLRTKITIVENNGEDFIDKILMLDGGNGFV